MNKNNTEDILIVDFGGKVNKRGQGMTLGMIIAIVLGIAVLTFLIFGSFFGWERLQNVIFNIEGGDSNVDDIVKGCNLACGSNSVYDYCEVIRIVDFGDEVSVKGSCKDLEGNDLVGLEVCEINCEVLIEEVEVEDVEVEDDGERESGDDDDEDDSEKDSSDPGDTNSPIIVISGRVVDGSTGGHLEGRTGGLLNSEFWGVNFDNSKSVDIKTEDGSFEVSLVVEENSWWVRAPCYTHLFHFPELSYIKIWEKNEEGFFLSAPNYEEKWISFSEFSEENEFVVDIGDFPLYPSWSIRMRSEEEVVFSMYYMEEGKVEGFSHGKIAPSVVKPYIVPRDRDFFVRVVDENENSYVSAMNNQIPSSYLACGMVEVEYSGGSFADFDFVDRIHIWDWSGDY